MWLAPLINPQIESKREEDKNYQTEYNTIFMIFDYPVIISAINFWNYTKTPKRGVRELEIQIDDLLIYRVINYIDN
jgi:protein JBTS26